MRGKGACELLRVMGVSRREGEGVPREGRGRDGIEGLARRVLLAEGNETMRGERVGRIQQN